jgi:hypothetical protein
MTVDRSARAWMAAIASGFLSSSALAAVPRIVDTAVESPSINGVTNTMLYDVTVTVDGVGSDTGHSAVVGYVSDDDYSTCGGTTAWKWSHRERFNTTDTRTWTLYNFQPGTTYHYKVTVGVGANARSRCGILETPEAPTPTVPTNLGYLNFQFDKAGPAHPFHTRYMMVETDDCGTGLGGARDYLVVLDTETEAIVWYLDIAAGVDRENAVAGGYRYQPGPTATSGRILMNVARSTLIEWGFDARVAESYGFDEVGDCGAGTSGAEGPCLHHDVFQSDDTGNTYAMTTVLDTRGTTGTIWEDACPAGTGFVNDGYGVLNDSFELESLQYLMTDYDYDPTVDAGPNGTKLASRPNACVGDTWSHSFDAPDGVIDWTHANSIAASSFGPSEVIDVSVKNWDQIVRFDASTGAMVWRLSPHAGYTDFGTLQKAPGVVGSASFADQHGVEAIAADTLLMLDNQGDVGGGARAIQVHVDTSPPSAVIEKSWAMVNAAGNPLECELGGNAELVPGSDNTLVLCEHLRIAAELDDPTGNTGGTPPLVISLPNGVSAPFCTTGGPADRGSLRGWHRAYPLTTVGEF